MKINSKTFGSSTRLSQYVILCTALHAKRPISREPSMPVIGGLETYLFLHLSRTRHIDRILQQITSVPYIHTHKGSCNLMDNCKRMFFQLRNDIYIFSFIIVRSLYPYVFHILLRCIFEKGGRFFFLFSLLHCCLEICYLIIDFPCIQWLSSTSKHVHIIALKTFI